MHPNCRSTTEAVFEDEIESTRIARTEDGSQYMVPRDMNYAEWKEKYVNNLPVHADVLRGVDRIDITDTDVVKSTLEHYEALILNETVENAIVITTTGKIIHCIGDLNGVHHEILGDELSGAIITHNHPMGSDNEYSFSSANIMLFNEYNVRTLRGIDERYIYEISRDYTEIDDLIDIMYMSEDGSDYMHNKVVEEALKNGYGYKRRRQS